MDMHKIVRVYKDLDQHQVLDLGAGLLAEARTREPGTSYQLTQYLNDRGSRVLQVTGTGWVIQCEVLP